MKEYLVALNEKDVKLLDKCMKLAIAELKEGSESNEHLSFVYEEIQKDMLKLANKINEQLKIKNLNL